MNTNAKRAMKTLVKNVDRYSELVERKLSKPGKKADPALVYSAAKYYPVLKKLARQ